MIARLSGRFGQRGVWLMVIGVTWILFGVGVLLEPTPKRPWVLYEQVPIEIQAGVWVITGAIAIWQGARGPKVDDSLGHVALYLMPAVRVLSFGLSWLLYLGSAVAMHFGFADTTIGLAQGWYAAVVWAVVSLMLALAASWPNPVTPIPRPPASALSGD